MAHKRPRDNSPSKFVASCLGKINHKTPHFALDLPCGYGRHAFYMASLGYDVIGADINLAALKYVEQEKSQSTPTIYSICIDAAHGLPLENNVFHLAVVVHYVEPQLIDKIGQLIAPGGYLIYESYGAHGENWKTLPEKGQTQKELGHSFDIIEIQERSAGPIAFNKVLVKLFSVKKFAN